VKANKIGILKINANTPTAAYTFIRVNHPFLFGTLSLGVVTPSAFQIAALKEYSGAYPRTIDKGIPLYIKYFCRYITHKNFSIRPPPAILLRET
jgi:hypothetical protein